MKLAPGLEGRLGDIVGGKDDQLAADGKSYVPFKGIVSYFALGFGEKYQAITESHTEQFGGKEVILRPREDAPVEPTEEKPDKKVEE